MHNRAGAVTEALKNYVEPSGALAVLRQTGSLSVLDACFGLGYNSWILIAEILASEIAAGAVRVVAIDRSAEILDRAATVLDDPRLFRVKALCHGNQGWAGGRFDARAENTGRTGLLTVTLEVLVGDLRALVPGLNGRFDLVFHDPFSPARMPELWTVDLFRHYRRLLGLSCGRVLTYSAATAVRAGLSEAGFTVWRTAAVGGKSGGTLASLAQGHPGGPETYALHEDEERRLRSRSGVPYRDPDLGSTREAILERRRKEQDELA
ncbi:MAG TPA: MnmC family methyltransferase [Candidatus Obscuribacterales bacterium]